MQKRRWLLCMPLCAASNVPRGTFHSTPQENARSGMPALCLRNRQLPFARKGKPHKKMTLNRKGDT